MFNSYFIMDKISLLLVGLFLLVFISTAYYLVGHIRREKINFKNFNHKIVFYDVKVNPIFQGLFYVIILLNGILVLFTSFTESAELRVYAIPYLIIFVLLIAVYMTYTILSQLNEDMTLYKNNYSSVNSALEKKKVAEKSIEKTLEYKTDVIGLIVNFENQIKTVEDPQKFNLKDSIQIIDQFVETQTKTIKGYEIEVIERFNKTLEQYFERRIPIKLELPKVSLDFEVDYNSIRSEVYNKYSKIFNDTLYTLVETKKYKTSAIITSGLQMLKDNNYPPTQDLVELILLSIDNIEGSPRELIDYLLSKKIVELEDLISYSINKKILWVFKNNLFESQEQLSTISERLIKEDAYTQSVAFISNYFARLKNVLAFMDKTKEANKTINLFNSYKKVMNVDATFYSESKVFENKLMSVKGFFKDRKITDQLKRELQDISDIKKAYDNKNQIDQVYKTVQDKFDLLKLNSTQSLLLYSGLKNENSLFDLEKTSKLFSDFYNRLLMKDLVVASLLLYSVFLYSNEDEELYNEVIDAFKTTREYSQVLTHINLEMKFEDHKTLARSIIQNILLKEEQPRLSNIVVNLEKERLTLRKLAKIR